MFQSKACLSCINQLLPESEKVSGMLRFLLRNLEKLVFVTFFGHCFNAFQADITYKVLKHLTCICKEDSNEASHSPFVLWDLFFYLFCSTLISTELFTINDGQSLQWGIYTYKITTDSHTPCDQSIQITP